MPGARSSELPRTIEKSDPAAPELARGALTEQPPILRAVARTLVRNASEVEDLVQDVFEKALRSIDRIDLDANPRGWMVTILHNLHIDRCRRRARCILAGCAACRAGLHDALQLIALEARATAPAAARDPAGRAERSPAGRARVGAAAYLLLGEPARATAYLDRAPASVDVAADRALVLLTTGTPGRAGIPGELARRIGKNCIVRHAATVAAERRIGPILSRWLGPGGELQYNRGVQSGPSTPCLVARSVRATETM